MSRILYMVGSKKDISERIRKFFESDATSAKATKAVLALLAFGAIAAVGIAAPNMFQIFRTRLKKQQFSENRLRGAFASLERSGCISVRRNVDDKLFISLTKKGEQYAERISIESLSILPMKRWDRKWRVVIFDIPVRLTKGRDGLRWKLKDVGFYHFQKSAFVYPYPCHREVLFTANFFNVTRFVEILTVESLSRDSELRRYFKLPLD